MKNKTLILILVITLIVPQVVSAAWWNPFSWFDKWSFIRKGGDETQILENRVRELEKKLEDVATSTTNNVKEEKTISKPPASNLNNTSKTLQSSQGTNANSVAIFSYESAVKLIDLQLNKWMEYPL